MEMFFLVCDDEAEENRMEEELELLNRELEVEASTSDVPMFGSRRMSRYSSNDNGVIPRKTQNNGPAYNLQSR